jgi:dTDP-L-rhamnose 4-epimerase
MPEAKHKILIIGGAGFIGSGTALRLLADGHQVRILDSFDPQIHGEDLKKSATLRTVWEGAEVQVGDARDPVAVDRALRGIDTVYYFAAGTGTGQSMYQVRQYTDVNVNAAAVLAEQLIQKKGDVRRVVVSSSRAVYGEGAYRCPEHGPVFPKTRSVDAMQKGQFEPVCTVCGLAVEAATSSEGDPVQPTSVYGITKYAQEQVVLNLCAAMGISAVALRYQNVYGPGQSLRNPYTGILSIFSQLLLEKRQINVFEDGLASRDFVFIDDVVECNLRAGLRSIAGGSVLNVGTGMRQTLLDVVAALAKAYGCEADFRVSGQFRIGDIRHAAADGTKLREVLGDHSFTDFEQGIAAFAKWVQGEEIDRALAQSYLRSLNEMSASGLLKGAH